jgi:DNA-binding winged helix-turn-helix (wHTH) protein/tetratricopeptide (TPR) repeat protein
MPLGPATPPPPAGAGIYRFGAFVLDPRERRLTRDGHVVDLRPKTFDALVLLVTRGGRLVTKDEFFATLWPRVVVGDASLNKCIWQLRQALGESETQPYIETVPKIGYRFIAALDVLAANAATLAGSATAAATPVPGVPAAAAPSADAPVLQSPPAPSSPPAGDVDLERGPLQPPTTSAAAQPVRARRWPWLLVVALTALALLLIELPGRETPRPSPPATGGNVLALARLDDLNPRDGSGWLGTALNELAAVQFAGIDRVRVTPADTLRDFGFDSVSSARAATMELPAAIRANWRLTGSYVVVDVPGMPREVQFTLVVNDADAGGELAQATRRGLERDLFEMVSAAGAELRQELGLTNPREAAWSDERTVVPADPDALAAYAAGLTALRRFDLLEATRLLQEVGARAPDFAPAYAALAQAWYLLGHERRAREAIDAAERLATPLPRALRLSYAAQAAELRADWDDAIKGFEALATLYPEDAEHGLRLAMAQVRAGRYADAVATLDRLVRTVPASAEDPRVLYTRARAHYLSADAQSALDEAARARAFAERDRAPLLAAEAALHHGWALQVLGRTEESDAAYRWARDTFAAASHAVSAARAAFLLLQSRFARSGKYESHEPEIRELLALARAAGSRRIESAALSMTCNLYWITRRTVEGRKANLELLELERELGDRQGEARALVMLASLDEADGTTEAAVAHYEQAAAMLREIEGVSDLAWALVEHGELERLRGRFARAAELFDEVAALGAKLSDVQQLGDAEYHRAILALDRHDLAEGVARIKAAVGHFTTMQHQERVALATAVEAELALAQGRVADAAGAMQRNQQTMGELSASGGTAWSYAFGARVQIEQGDLEGAREQMRRATADLPDLATSITGATARLYLAEDHWLLGEAEAARTLWTAVERDARRRGLEMLRLEAALGLACADAPALAARVAEAQAMGFGRGVAWARAQCPRPRR